MVFHVGDEMYENQMRFSKRTFAELDKIKRDGYLFQGVHHEIDVVFCCDWKAGACIEGLNTATSKYFCRYCYCTKRKGVY